MILARAYGQASGGRAVLPASYEEVAGTVRVGGAEFAQLDQTTAPLWARRDLIVLHGSTAQAGAADLESRFSEAALGPVLLADYRNFAHVPLEERRLINWDHPDAFDWDLLLEQLGALVNGRSIEKPVYDFVSHTRSVQTVRINAAEVVVIDGFLLFVDERVRELCDVKVFVDADADIRLIRRIRRDVAKRGRPLDDVIEQYLTTVQPMHLQFVEPSKRYADVIVPRGWHNPVAIEMIVAKIERRLAATRADDSARAAEGARA